MRRKPRSAAIPGVDGRAFMHLVVLILPMVVFVGLWVAPLVLLALFAHKPLVRWRTRRFGPPVANPTVETEWRRQTRVLGGVVVGWVVLGLLLDRAVADPKRALAIAAVVALAALIWLRPSMVVLPVLVSAAVTGGTVLLASAPLVVMISRRDQRLRLKIPRTVGRTAMTLACAAVALLVALPFANTSAGTLDANVTSAPASPTGADSLVRRLINWVRPDGTLDLSTSDRPVSRLPESLPPSGSTPWIPYLLLAGCIVVAIVAAVWFWRLRRRPVRPHRPHSASTMARLEHIGADVGRQRRRNEGALSFAAALVKRTGDKRLEEVGRLVSGDVYGSAVEEHVVSSQLAAVEAAPPSAPPRPPIAKRLGDRLRQLPVSRHGLIGAVRSLAAAAALVWFAAPQLGDLRQSPHRDLAYVEDVVAPPVWNAVMSAPANELSGWQSCSSTAYEPATLNVISAGLSHRFEAMAVEVRVNIRDGHSDSATLTAGTNDRAGWTPLRTSNDVVRLDPDSWQTSEWASVSPQPFATIDDVLVAVRVNEPIRTDHVDRNGDRFIRYESLPPKREALDNADRPTSPIELDHAEFMRAVDIWVDDNRVPVRVRLMSDGSPNQWIEWRRVVVQDDDRLPFPRCAIDPPWANEGWIGAAPWTPSRSVPMQVAFDDQGNPFDNVAWQPEDITSEHGGAFTVPVETLTLGDLTSIARIESAVEGDELPDRSFTVGWPEGARIEVVRADGWPSATRIDAIGERVDHWDEPMPFRLYESFLTAVSADSFPEFEPGELDALLAPLWDDTNYVVAGDGRSENDRMLVLTQSESTVVIAGRNSDGEIVSIAVWDEWVAWRQLGFEGKPPPSVQQRENELRDCLAGDREVQRNGRCT